MAVQRLRALPAARAPEFVSAGPAGSGWALRHDAKYSGDGVERVVSPEATIERVLPLLGAIGVTRLADVTGLDRVGIPNYTTVRPREADAGGISYYNGKGATLQDAKAGALMEAVERYTGERCDLPVFYRTRAEMERSGDVVDPGDLVEPRLRGYDPGARLEWVQGHDLIADRPTWVPLNAVICPYVPTAGAAQLFLSHTNGLASGNTLEEAVCHAMCEVAERDASALADAVDLLVEPVRLLRSVAGLAGAPAAPHARLIDTDTLPDRARALVARMESAGLLVYLRDLRASTGIPTFDCLAIERQLDGRHLVHGGYGCHPDARVAVTRALTETAQSRLAVIQGGREDLAHIVHPVAPFDPEEVFAGRARHAYDTVASHEHAHVDDDIRVMLEGMRRAGLRQVVAVDLTRPELGIPVVRVVIPGAETWRVFYSHGVRARLGPRANARLHEAVCA